MRSLYFYFSFREEMNSSFTILEIYRYLPQLERFHSLQHNLRTGNAEVSTFMWHNDQLIEYFERMNFMLVYLHAGVFMLRKL